MATHSRRSITIIAVLIVIGRIKCQKCRSNKVLLSYPRTLFSYIICKQFIVQDDVRNDKVDQKDGTFKYITFEESIVSKISPGLFNSIEVSEIYLNNSKVETVEPGAFNGAKLENLHLEQNNIKEIVRGTLNSLMNLKVIDLSRNDLYKIEDNSFYGLLKLEALDLAHNKLQNLTASTFSSLTSLISLNISNNRLVSIERYAFANMLSLKKLLLYNNSLTNLQEGVFENATELLTLDISYNQVEELDFGVLPKSLENVNIQFNGLNTAKSWNYLQNSKSMHVQHNNIKEISNTGPRILYLTADWNKIETITANAFNQSRTMILLRLSHNLIRKLEVNSFNNLGELQNLFLSHNLLKELPLGCFKALYTLSGLDLSNNLLINLEFGMFTGLSNLDSLYLNYNNLTVINENYFHNLHNLRTLHLSGNALRELNAKLLSKHMPRLVHIYISGNNWWCNSLMSFVLYYPSTITYEASNQVYDRPNINGVGCVDDRTSNNSKPDENSILPSPNAPTTWNETLFNDFHGSLDVDVGNSSIRNRTVFDLNVESNLYVSKKLDNISKFIANIDYNLDKDPSRRILELLIIVILLIVIVILILILIILYLSYRRNNFVGKKSEQELQLTGNFQNSDYY